MDKRGPKILVGCMVCTLVIIILFLVAIRFSKPNCELIIVAPGQQLHFGAPKLVRSNDRSMLMRISAYIEQSSLPSVGANTQPGPAEPILIGAPPSSAAAPPPPPPTAPVQQPTSQTRDDWPIFHKLVGAGTRAPAANGTVAQPASGAPTQAALVLAPQPAANATWPAAAPNGTLAGKPSDEAPKTLGAQLDNTSAAAAAGRLNGTTGTAGTGAPANIRRYMPLELESIASKRMEDGRYKYSLHFNCSTLILRVVRRVDRVFVDQASLEWHSGPARRRTSCELQVSYLGTLGTDSRQGVARCRRDGPLVYKCQPEQQPQDAQIELHINNVEFEISSNDTSGSHFRGARTLCTL